MLKRTESGIQPVTPPPSPSPTQPKIEEEEDKEEEETSMPPPPPRKPRRRLKRRRPNQGDTPHLQKWREFYKTWYDKHGEHETVAGMKHIEKARAAGVAYRHSVGKKRESDPAEPEFPI